MAPLHEPINPKIAINRINISSLAAIVVGGHKLPQLIKQAGGLPKRAGGFHGKFIFGYLSSSFTSKPVCKRLADDWPG
ncbi:hypothetical protein [Limnohabitans sp.]|uniref:hypothetical protein n=1 Tax=Limnohabitans sp. TaxID=1907725 RepID=UPI0025BD43B7|nr:hypothetical protein [Limnohabitans sp.]